MLGIKIDQFNYMPCRISRCFVTNKLRKYYKDKMQDTAQFQILRTYKLFKKNFKCESYLSLKKVSIELHLLNFELVVTI